MTESQSRFDRLIDELKGVRDAVEQLYVLFDHMYRNREELAALLRAEPEEIEESVLCRECNAECELTTALREGWIEIECDTDGQAIGFCVSCQEQELAEAEANCMPPSASASGELRQRVQGSLDFIE